MTSNRFIQFTFIILMAALAGCQTKKHGIIEHRPNVILIMADDLGWGDTGFNGNKVIKTPSLDKMAQEGIRFNRFYSASSVCSPTRASVLTGRNPYRMGVYNANVGILRPEEITLPELLKEHGYATGHFGKWHLGTLTAEEKDSNRGNPGNLKEYNPPARHGYDVAFVTEAKVPTWDPMKKPVERFKREGWNYLKPGEPYTAFGTHYWDIDGNKITDNLEGDDSRIIMDRVLPFIDKSTAEGNPFLAVIWFHAPHMPCVAGPEYAAMYKEHDEAMQNYAGCITAMDEQIGRLRLHLKDAGIDENTMIWFCSDNGPENGNPGTTAGFRERKRSLYEGGVRVPGLLVWPAKIKQGFETDVPCVTSDYLPTIMDILNIETEKTPYILDGISLKTLMEGEMKERPKPIGFCIRNQASMSGNRFKVYVKDGIPEYYDIVNDPYEENPVRDPEEIKEMKNNLDAFLQSARESFEGGEYGTGSYDKLLQKWADPYNLNAKIP